MPALTVSLAGSSGLKKVVALAINANGKKEVLGLWIERTERATFWLKVVNELRTRGVNYTLIAIVDGLTAPAGDHDGVPSDPVSDLHRASDWE